jgi:Family of unknown function (DUF6492)
MILNQEKLGNTPAVASVKKGVMDILCVSYWKDVRLLEIMVKSLQTYVKSCYRLTIIWDEKSAELFAGKLPEGTRIIQEREVMELGRIGYVNQSLIKLVAHRYMNSEYFLIVDSDFVFTRPLDLRQLFNHHGLPYWFYTDWHEDWASIKWKSSSDEILRGQAPFLFLEESQFVVSKTVLKEMEATGVTKQILAYSEVAEFHLFGWYTYWKHRHLYDFIKADPFAPGQKLLFRRVNQIPPSYWVLDPLVSWGIFQDAYAVVFWSHWELAESKMREFFQASKLHWGIGD